MAVVYLKKLQKNLQRNYCLCTSVAVFFCNTICVADISATHHLSLHNLKFFVFCNEFCVAEFGDICNAVKTLQITEFSISYNSHICIADKICNEFSVADCQDPVIIVFNSAMHNALQ